MIATVTCHKHGSRRRHDGVATVWSLPSAGVAVWLSCVVFALSGCGATPASTQSDGAIQLEAIAEPLNEAPVPPGGTDEPAAVPIAEPAPQSHANAGSPSFPIATFYELLVAEIAGIRGELDVALEYYRRQAITTRDPGVVARAVQTASYQRNQEILRELCILWAEVEPDNMQANSVAFHAFVEGKDFDRAFTTALHMNALGRDEGLTLLPQYTAQLEPGRREVLLGRFVDAVAADPDDHALALGTALLLLQQQRAEDAEIRIRGILAARPDHEGALLAQSQVLVQRGDGDKTAAIAHLRKALALLPDSERLRLTLVRFLAQSQELPGAINEMEVLVAMQPEKATLRLGMAMLLRESGDRRRARAIYQQLLDDNQQVSAAHYYLGTLAQEDGDTHQAISHYRRVRDKKRLTAAAERLTQLLAGSGQLNDARLYLYDLRVKIPSQASVFYKMEAELLVAQGRHDSAADLLNESLDKFPDDVDLLYSRSRNHEKLGNLTAAEQDLRGIIDRDANNAVALNALGYTLTVHTQRYDEALALIQRAIEIRPDDPAIVDSLGWVLYKRGDYDGALRHLRAAMARFPDPEIAAHLGEVLWMSGRRDEAREVLQQAVDRDPESVFLLDTLKRLNVQP